MSNTSSTPVTIEAINALLKRTDTLERAATAPTRGDLKMWYRPITELSSGWWVCDGSTAPDGVVTPDLRRRFPVGLRSDDTAFDTLGETGGALTANLQHSHTITHTHTITHVHTMAHAHTMAHVHPGSSLGLSGLSDTATPAGGIVDSGTGATADPTLHKHGVTGITVTGNTGAESNANTSGSSSTNTGGSSAADTGASSAANSGDALSSTQSILPPYAVVHFAYRWA